MKQEDYDPITATNAELLEHGKRQIERRAHLRPQPSDPTTEVLNMVTGHRDRLQRENAALRAIVQSQARRLILMEEQLRRHIGRRKEL